MSSSVSQFLSREIPNAINWAARFRLSAGVVVCFSLFWGVSRALRIPTVIGMGGSLLSQPGQSAAIGAVAVTLILCTLIGKFIVGDVVIGTAVQHEGGLVAAVLGMVAVAFRLGAVRYAMFAMPQPGSMLLLVAELLLIYVIIAFCWLILQWIAAPFTPAQPSPEQPSPLPHAPPLATNLSALAFHVVVMSACMLFLAGSDATAQGYAAVGISAALASMAAHLMFPVRSSIWFWISPALVGTLGYLFVYFSPSGLAIGYPDNWAGALSRATPLAYASAGPAGAIFGFWIALGWQQGEGE